MYHFFKKSIIDLSSIGVDLHNHVLPHIDDGSESISTSLLLRKTLESWGINNLIYTPHIYKDLYPNNSEAIKQSYHIFTGDISFNKDYTGDTFAAEYMLDEFFKQEIENKKKLLCIKKNLVLIEFPTYFKSPFIDTVIFELLLSGYQPIIAHPERYLYYNFRDFMKLKDLGCLFQINYLSLANRTDKDIRKNAEQLLKANLVDYISTDLHNLSQLDELSKFLQSPSWNNYKRYPFKNSNLLHHN
ncbi:tyrosine-protein phosphatase YwqE [Pedobacter glucosidilyticus]|nr:CpsB/CapC family capsule biosynthesis tyrosine phosphatase [Pedobacter glucosidilyticus]KHJ38151.1 tyrosine-protein phosphatase YwqE [Pedobacter glucosidilyticus]